jgi:hypothetical protein
MIYFHYFAPERVQEPTDYPIYLIQQFYVDKNAARHAENVFCLQRNVANTHLKSIFLLNEREYSAAELGVDDPEGKIQQIVIKNRLLYSDVFSYVSSQNIDGYVVFANTDIFLDDSIVELRHTNLHCKKQMYALLRYEYDPISENSSLFGPRYDSQDTWIFHSSQNISLHQYRALRFPFGKPGCDNKFIYVTSALGYELFNDPLTIKTRHYHTSQARNYSVKDTLPPPYSMLIPHGIPNDQILASFGRMPTGDIGKWANEWTRFSWKTDNLNMKRWIESKREKRMKFSVFSNMFLDDLSLVDPSHDFSNTEVKKAEKYYNSDIFISPNVNAVIGRNVLDVYHFVHFEPWTWALKGSRILFAVGASMKLATAMRDKWAVRTNIYGCDFFQECSADFIYVDTNSGKYPATEGYDVVITDSRSQFIIDSFKRGRSIIVLESALALLFGIFDANSMKTRPDILRMYLNSFWTKIE